MHPQLILTQPAYLLAACVLAGALAAALLYFGERTLARGPRVGLAALRGLAVGLLAFLLLGPLLRSVDTRTQKPVVVLAEDRSASVAGAVDSLGGALDALASELSERYDVQRLGLGERVRDLPAADTAADAATDLGQVFDYVADNVPPELLGGVVLVTDGIFNRGADPVYAAAKLTAPVYAVPLGDTTPARDVAVKDVLYNRIAYLGDRLELQVDVLADNVSGTSTTVTVADLTGGKRRQLDAETYAVARGRDFRTLTFEVEPKSAGVHRYRIAASGPPDERNRANNVRDVYVDVLDARQRILILAAAPHPDVSALRQTLDANANYETTFAIADAFDGDLGEVDLVILHNLPGRGASVEPLLARLDERGVGRWFIAGTGADLRALSSAQGLTSVTPKGAAGNEVLPQLNGAFRLFTLGESWAQTINAWPPIAAPFAQYGELTGGDALLRQRIGRVDTEYPLLAMGEVSGRKVGLMTADGLWRWRLAEYLASETHDVFDGLVLATVQYLALREDKRPFRVSASERVYTTIDDVRLRGELYNASFELVNDPDVRIRVVDAEGTDYTYVMDKVGAAYQLRAGRLPAGDYRFTATTDYDGEAYEASGGFTVRQLQLEGLSETADWELLRRLARQQGGELIRAGALGGLSATLLGEGAAKPVAYDTVRTRPLIDWPWLLAIVLSLLAAEWFARRRLGTY